MFDFGSIVLTNSTVNDAYAQYKSITILSITFTLPTHSHFVIRVACCKIWKLSKASELPNGPLCRDTSPRIHYIQNRRQQLGSGPAPWIAENVLT